MKHISGSLFLFFFHCTGSLVGSSYQKTKILLFWDDYLYYFNIFPLLSGFLFCFILFVAGLWGRLFVSISGILIICYIDLPGVLLFSLYFLDWVFCEGCCCFLSFCFIAKKISPTLSSFIFHTSMNSFSSLTAIFTSMMVLFYGCIKFSGLFKDVNNRFLMFSSIPWIISLSKNNLLNSGSHTSSAWSPSPPSQPPKSAEAVAGTLTGLSTFVFLSLRNRCPSLPDVHCFTDRCFMYFIRVWLFPLGRYIQFPLFLFRKKQGVCVCVCVCSYYFYKSRYIFEISY